VAGAYEVGGAHEVASAYEVASAHEVASAYEVASAQSAHAVYKKAVLIFHKPHHQQIPLIRVEALQTVLSTIAI
jgi:hypothetical protein